MPGSFKRLVLVGAVLICGAAAIASTGAAAASTGPPQIMTTYFGATIYPCSNGTCAIGPGNKGMPFTAAMIGTGGPPYGGPESNPYQMSVVSGTLPPGLKLALPDAEWVITGTPTAPGTYTFTVQIVALAGGPDGYQTFTITIGNGTSDHLVIAGAAYLEKFGTLRVSGFDVNVGATYTVYNTSTGAEIGTLREDNSGNPGAPFPGDGGMVLNTHISPPPTSQQVTIKDSLGSSVTVPVVRVAPYG
jgi:putative Ig domain-containing protein